MTSETLTFKVVYLDKANKQKSIKISASNIYRVSKKVYEAIGYKCWIVSTVEIDPNAKETVEKHSLGMIAN